jgi:cyclophilin family peptidyl-prolyl cis-trans isomerase
MMTLAAAVLVMAGAVSLTAHAAGKPAARPAKKGAPVGDERILLRTNRGDLVVGLYESIAPNHATQIRKLVRLGVYDTTTLFRVEPGYLVQITDAQNRKTPLTSEQRKAIARIPAELSKLPHRKGTVSMARRQALDSAETSFSFMLGRAPDLDGEYTVIGELEFGQPLLDQIAREPRDHMNRPLTPIMVEQALVKTGAEIAQLRASGELRGPQRLPR